MFCKKGLAAYGTALRCAMALMILIASLARGAVVLEIKHEHHHDHDFHHSHEHAPVNGQPDHDDDGNDETDPERDTGKHAHLLVMELGPMMPHATGHAGLLPVSGSAACARIHEQCPDGPVFELLKPPQ